MILIDTNLIIDYLKGSDTILQKLMGKEELAICGIVLAELLHGVSSNSQKQLILDASEDFSWISIDDSIWHSVGSNLNNLRKKGLNCPFQDVVLASLCIEHNIRIASNDKHFHKIAEILTDLNIYS